MNAGKAIGPCLLYTSLAVEAAFCFGAKIDRGIRTVFEQCENASGMEMCIRDRFLFGGNLLKVFSSDTQVLHYATQMMHFLVPGYLCLAIAHTYCGVVRGCLLYTSLRVREQLRDHITEIWGVLILGQGRFPPFNR